MKMLKKAVILTAFFCLKISVNMALICWGNQRYVIAYIEGFFLTK